MKKIDNKKVSIIGKEVSYSELILTSYETAPQGGWTPKAMATAIKVDSIMKEGKDKEVIEVEDADMEDIKKTIDNMKWAVKDIEIVNFCDYIKSIK